MKRAEEDPHVEMPPRAAPLKESGRPSFPRFILSVGALIFFFGSPLYDLGRFAFKTDLYSYILIIPAIALYLVWDKRKTLPPNSNPTSRVAIILWGAGAAALGIYWTSRSRSSLADQNYLAWMTLTFLLFFSGICAFFIGRERLSALAFPLAFLGFVIPFPIFLEAGINTALQHGSAVVAYKLFLISNTPVFYDDLVFQLPNIRLKVAPECSGIRSTVVLLITSLLAGRFFLRSPWRGAILMLAIIPLAMLRNGLRIFTVGELCVQVGPRMIDSVLHRRGGPLFFALSLFPLTLLLWGLRKSEGPRGMKDGGTIG